MEDEALLRVWWTVSAMLVLLMQLGFICLEMGCVREGSRPGIAVKNFMMLLVSSILFTLIGVRLMYGTEGNGFVGWGTPDLTSLDSYAWLFFQAGFAAVAATILSGALAGRSTLFSNVVMAGLMALVIYPVFGHWIWAADGWLQTRGVKDFAGSGAVHFLGGFTALVGCRVLGGRGGFLDENGKPQDVATRSLPFTTIGVVFLWVGWIGFNGGSVLPVHLALASEDGGKGFEVIGGAVLATCCAASGGGLVAMVLAGLHKWKFGIGERIGLFEAFRQQLLFDAWATLGGTMGGMVAVTANCDWLVLEHPHSFLWLSVGIGFVGGAAAFGAALFVRDVMKIDDPVEAIAVHAGAGAAGFLLAGFAADGSFLTQMAGLVAAVAWISFTAYPCLRILDRFGLLRVSPGEEEIGLTFESYEAEVLTREMIEDERRERHRGDPVGAGSEAEARS